MTNNKTILAWIDEMKALVNPDQVVWIDGSEEQLEELRKEAVESGEMIKLNQEKLPRAISYSILYASCGSFQWLVGPASSSFLEQMRVLSSTRATSFGAVL